MLMSKILGWSIDHPLTRPLPIIVGAWNQELRQGKTFEAEKPVSVRVILTNIYEIRR